jgi:CRP-like cAMP-binding protein
VAVVSAMPDVLNWKLILKTDKLFGELDVHEIDVLLRPSNSSELVKEAHKDPIIFRQGDAGDSIYLIGEGEASVVLTKRDDTTFTVATLIKGDLFGEMAFFEQRPRSATIIARVANNRCILREFKAHPFRTFLASHPSLEFKLTALLSERLRKLTEGILQAQLEDIDDRFALLNSKIEAESKIFDNAVKTTQALLDNTKQRAEELSAQAKDVIETEKHRQATFSKYIGWALAIGTPLTFVLGIFGYQSLDGVYKDIIKRGQDITTVQQRIRDKEAAISTSEQHVRDIERHIRDIERHTKNDIDSIAAARREINSYKEYILPLYLRYVAMDEIFFKALQDPVSSAQELNTIFLEVMRLDHSPQILNKDQSTQFSAKTKRTFLQRIFHEILTDEQGHRTPLRKVLSDNIGKLDYRDDRPLIYYFILLAHARAGEPADAQLLANMEEDKKRGFDSDFEEAYDSDFGPKQIKAELFSVYYNKITKQDEPKLTDEEEQAANDAADAEASNEAQRLSKWWREIIKPPQY